MSQKRTILLSEDEESDAKLVQALLHANGDYPVDVHTCRTLADGLRRLGELPVDVILLDLGLPDTNGGLETVERTQNACRGNIPIVVFTACDEVDVSIDAIQQGVQDYVIKGRLDGELLRRSIEYSIERHALLLRERERL